MSPSLNETDVASSPSFMFRSNKMTMSIYLSYLFSIIVVAFVTYQLAPVHRTWAVVVSSALLGSGGLYVLSRSLFSLQNIMIRTAEHMVQNRTEVLAEEWESAMQGSNQSGLEEKIVEVLPEEERRRIENLEQSLTVLKEKYSKVKEEFEGLICEGESAKGSLAEVQAELAKYKEMENCRLVEKGKIAEEYHVQIGDLKKHSSEQKNLLKQKNVRIERLESKVLDLKYEVKTLLELESMNHTSHSMGNEQKKKFSDIISTDEDLGHLEEADLEELCNDLPVSSDPSFQSNYDRFMLLKRCVEIAKKVNGVQNALGDTRFQGIRTERYMIDLRRLFENLRRENTNSGIVFLYSRREGRLLFANNEVKGALGWSPEKFVKDFPKIVQHGFQDWNQAVTSTKRNFGPLQLVVRTKEGEGQKVSCYLATVPDGAFADDVIGVLYPAA